MKEIKTRYYSDIKNEDYAGTNIKTKDLPEDFVYVHHKNIFYRFGGFLLYYLVAKPVIWLINYPCYHYKFINKKCLKEVKGKGYFIYSNHTNCMYDAFTPNLCRTKRNYIIVSRDTTSIPCVRTIVMQLGAIPLPGKDSKVLYDKFNDCVKHRVVDQNRTITIYPEAHVWPWYTGIREFSHRSFKYPVDLNVPVYSFTTTYVKSKSPFRKHRPVARIYINGPFYPNTSLNRDDAMKELRDKVYNQMVLNSTNVEQVIYKYRYIKK